MRNERPRTNKEEEKLKKWRGPKLKKRKTFILNWSKKNETGWMDNSIHQVPLVYIFFKVFFFSFFQSFFF